MNKINDPTGAFRRKFITDYPGNYRDWKQLQKLTQYSDFAHCIWEPLVMAKPKAPGACPSETACEFLSIACIPPEKFRFTGAPRREINKDLAAIKHRIANFMSVLDSIPVMELQARADEHTGLSRHTVGQPVLQWDVTKLIGLIRDDLALLVKIMDMDRPPPAPYEPRKRNAARVNSTTRAKLLKEYAEKLYGKTKLHAVIAEIVTALDDLDPPYTETDVSHA